jgi:acyl-CoA reductase-like NAD-dependent aldehyde dehydrogenase
VGHSFAELNDVQLEAAIATAATCFESSRQTSFAQRAAIVSKAATILRKRSDEFARAMMPKMGKLFPQAQDEVTLNADIIDYYANHAQYHGRQCRHGEACQLRAEMPVQRNRTLKGRSVRLASRIVRQSYGH